MASLWTSDAAAAATGGQATRPFAASGVAIDSRTLQPGDLFVALSDRRDGHAFVADALARGAAAAMVTHRPGDVGADTPLLIVPDVLEGLTALGRTGRARAGGRVVAITGSAGKTSTKEMLRTILSGQGTVHAAEASFNNHWGVPLTLARLPPEADFAVIEIGMNHPGEIAPLARLARPHVALVTTVGAAHLEAFDGIGAIAREKAAILDGLEPDGIAVLPADIEVTAILNALADSRGVARRLFGEAAGADCRLIEATLAGQVTVAKAELGGKPVLFRVQSPGRHFAMNALAALAVADALGCDRAVAIADLGRWQPPGGRGMRRRVGFDTVQDDLAFEVIDDAYNANPLSMAAALEVLGAAEPADGVGRVARGRRIAILGDMRELGPQEAAFHAALADHPAMARIDRVHCVGPLMQHLWAALPERLRGTMAESSADLLPQAHRLVDAGDIVLVKGSKAVGLHHLVDALVALGQGSARRSERGRTPGMQGAD